MMAEWISVGLLAFLVLVFVLDIASNRRRIPRPKPVPQRKPEAVKGPEPATPVGKKATETEAPPAPAPEEAVEIPAAVEPEVVAEPEPQVSVFERIKLGLGKTRASLTGGMADMFSAGKKIDEALLEEIETTLLMADVGVTATSEIIESLTDKLKRNQLKDGEALRKALR